jgi:predicted ATPase/DNA-binding SARP family transcriptional activator
MPSRLVLQLLGLPQVHLDDEPIATDRRKAIALLAYLTVNDISRGRQRYSRESLSALFWPDYEQAKAFSNLRRTIWEVHQAVGENWLIAERDSVHLNPEAEIDLDIARFRALISKSHKQPDLSLRIPLLVDVVKLYRNHFLTGFSLKDAYPFNEWVFSESEDLRRQLATALTTLAEDYCSLGQAEEAIPFARRLITLDPINEAAHRQLMEVYIQAGQHSAALKQYQTCEQILRKELGLDPQPETRALYKKIRKGEMKPVQVEKQTETIAPKHNLPLQLSTFIGREKEQEEITRLLKKNRLVTLAGVGGIGKTRLSLQVGQKLLRDYPDGIWFISLDSLSDPALVPQTIASVFDIRESRERPIIEILTNVLREKTTLLILDNCEHLLEACTKLITILLQNCPNLKILTTSREVLGISGEATYSIPSLSIPEREKTSIEKLTEYEAIQLFAERAALALSSFIITPENVEMVVDICHRLDGIPLAIELAAARVNMLQVNEIRKQLEHSFSMLTRDSYSIIQRHQTLRASMDWSWELLSQAEQIFLRQLSVFAGGWTLETAQVVCEGDALDLIGTLIKKSLIVANQDSGPETRYHFHEIVRQYAHEKLIESGEEEKIRTRHLKYFLELSEQIELGLHGPQQVEWFARMTTERDNLRAALEQAAKTDIEAGLYLSGRLRELWENFDLREGAGWLTEFIQKPESKDYPHARAKALLAQGWVLIWFQQFALASAAGREALELFRACADKQGEVDALLLLGNAWDSQEGLAKTEALEFKQQALTLAQSLGDKWRQAKALLHQKPDYRDRQRILADWEEARLLFRDVGDWRELTHLLGLVGWLRVWNGEIDLAQKYLDEATRSQALSSKAIIWVYAEMAKSWIALMRGDYEQARTLLQEMVTRAEVLGNRMEYLWYRVRLSYVALREGNLTEAQRLFAESARDFQKNKQDRGIVFALEGMASLYVAIKKPDFAARLIGWADATREKIDDTRPTVEQADVDKLIAACLAKMGEVAFSDAYDEGQKMSLDEAIAYALRES